MKKYIKKYDYYPCVTKAAKLVISVFAVLNYRSDRTNMNIIRTPRLQSRTAKLGLIIGHLLLPTL